MSCLIAVLWIGVGLVVALLLMYIERGLGLLALGIWFVGLVAFPVTIGLIDKRLQTAWRAEVTRRGWFFAPQAPELQARWPFMPFSADPEPEIVDVTSGVHRGRRFWLGRFRFGLGDTKVAFDFIDLEIQRPLPPMQVAPESLTGLVAPGIRPLDLHLESAEFNARYRLVRGEPAVVHAVLHPRVMAVLLGVQPFGFVTERDRFVAVMPSFRTPETILAQLDAACEIIELMPEHIWRAGESWVTAQAVTQGDDNAN
ncbi:hypothetical protein [Kribbella deserti]|uniref:DUF3137 domain-containing protein n=1 Tax=Kribbella deserti TaxID=1926257 RepID=A0ABV6QVT9_9ACTN